MQYSVYKLVLACLIVVINSCGGTHQEKKEPSDFDWETDYSEEITKEIADVRKIFYDIYSPVDAGNIFEQIDALFDPTLLNPHENATKYNTTNKIALNLGVYGANLSYSRLFGQTQEAINYLSAIYKLAGDIGISGELIEHADETLNKAMVSHPDTLFDIATRIFIEAEEQLRESGRESASVLILAGGWIEALYLATSFYDPMEPDDKLIAQLAGQKYSLERLISMMNNYRNEPDILEFIYKLEPLSEIFQKIEIYFREGDVDIDTISRTITASEPEFSYSPEYLTEIAELAASIRNSIVE